MNFEAVRLVKPAFDLENKRHIFQLKNVTFYAKKIKKGRRKSLKWFDGKKIDLELKEAGFKRYINENDLLLADRDREIK